MSLRRPLTVEEVPLPEGGGYTRELLDPDVRVRMLQAYTERKSKICQARAEILVACANSASARRAVHVQAMRDTQWWIEHFAVCYDDRYGEEEPLVLYDAQAQKIVRPYVDACATKAPTRVSSVHAKSRGQGYTWVSAACRTKSFLYAENWSILVGAENRDDVDDGGMAATHESTFGKIRFFIDHLPEWMRHDLLGPKYHKDEYNKRHHLSNPRKPRNVIHGKQLGGKFGRSRRYSEVWADEIAWAEEMDDADTSLKQTTYRFNGGSTPKGKDNFFYQCVTGGLDVLIYYLWWPENPLLSLEWYNNERKHMTDEQVAQELDISFSRSQGGRVLEEVSVATHFVIGLPRQAQLPGSNTTVSVVDAQYDPSLPLYLIIDPGWADHTAALWAQWHERERWGRIIDFVTANRVAIDWLVPFIIGRIPTETNKDQPWKHRYDEAEVEIIRRHQAWGLPDEMFGDAYGSTGNILTGWHSAYDELSEYVNDRGVTPVKIKAGEEREAISRTILMMRHMRVWHGLATQRNGGPGNPTFGEVIQNWRYPRSRPNQASSLDRPVHDVYCHGGDCLKILAMVLDLPEAGAWTLERGRAIVEGKYASDIQHRWKG